MLHLFQKQVIFIFSNNFFSPLQKLHHRRKKANMSDETNQFSLNLGSAGQNQKRTRDEPKPDRGFLGKYVFAYPSVANQWSRWSSTYSWSQTDWMYVINWFSKLQMNKIKKRNAVDQLKNFRVLWRCVIWLVQTEEAIGTNPSELWEFLAALWRKR